MQRLVMLALAALMVSGVAATAFASQPPIFEAGAPRVTSQPVIWEP